MALGMALGTLALLVACASTPTATDPAGPSEPAGSPTVPPSPSASVIPWADLPAGHQQIATHTIPASPDPMTADAAPTCATGQLTARLAHGGAAAGTAYYTFELDLVSGPSCRLDGTPDATATTSGGAVPTRGVGPDSSDYTGAVLVTPTDRAMIQLAWSTDWCVGATTVSAETLSWPSGSVVLPGLGHSPGCSDPGSGDRTPLQVFPFQPAHFTLASAHGSWDRVRASSPEMSQPTAAAGSTLRFAVTLDSIGQDTTLSPCPDYQIGFNGRGGIHAVTHQLNCAGVPYVHDGTPYLPADTPVTFSMQADVPASLGGAGDVAKFWWEIPTGSDAGQPMIATALTLTGGT